jgi:hypothetical protein
MSSEQKEARELINELEKQGVLSPQMAERLRRAAAATDALGRRRAYLLLAVALWFATALLAGISRWCVYHWVEGSGLMFGVLAVFAGFGGLISLIASDGGRPEQ